MCYHGLETIFERLFPKMTVALQSDNLKQFSSDNLIEFGNY